MKGDLHTLKRICGYASTVMALGEAVIAVATVAVLVAGSLSPFQDWAAEVLTSVTSLAVPSDAPSVANLARTLVVLVLGLFTVHTVRILMVSIIAEHSPFTDGNVRPMVVASKVYIVAAAVLGGLTALSTGSPGETVFVFFGCILIGVVLYCLGLIIRYGAVLQDESDHTL